MLTNGWGSPAGTVFIYGNEPVSESKKKETERREKALQKLEDEINQKEAELKSIYLSRFRDM